MTSSPLRVRSLLFVPGSRPDMVAKLARFAPDVAVVDLEDAVAADGKTDAREKTVAAVAELPPGPMRVLIRINPPGTSWHAADLEAAAGSRAHGVVVPKADSAQQVAAVRAALPPDAVVVAGIETGLGVADARSIVAGASACYFGAEDYIADLGGRRSAANTEVLYARSQVVLAARLAGVPAIDQAVMVLDDASVFAADARQGADLGYVGKICIHPRQVAWAHDAFTPGAQEVARARAVLAAATGGVTVVDGQMVDDVHLKLARAVLARAGEG